MWVFQQKMAQRSLANDPDRKIRSEVGKKGGRKTKSGIAIKKEERFIFYYKNEPILCVFNCETGTDVIKMLKGYPLAEKVPPRVTEILKGTRNIANGWSCEKLEEN